MAFRLKSHSEIDAIAKAGALVSACLHQALKLAEPGVSGRQIDLEIRGCLERNGLSPALLGCLDPGRPELEPFQGAISININSTVANAEPNDRPLEPGDLVTLDLAASLAGWHADASIPMVVGREEVDPVRTALVRAARDVSRAAIQALRPGGMWSVAVAAAHSEAERHGVHIAPGFAGHGIGKALHEPPQAEFNAVPNGSGDFLLAPGTVFTIEPIVTSELCQLVESDQARGVRTESGVPGACEERTIAITDSGVRTLCGVEL